MWMGGGGGGRLLKIDRGGGGGQNGKELVNICTVACKLKNIIFLLN